MVTKKIIKTTFKVRRGLSHIWADVNPVLEAGEPGFELDTHRLKIGDGETKWNSLPYIGGSSTTAPEMGDYITRAELEDLVKNLVKSSDEDNKVKILDDGTMEVNTVSFSKLIVDEDDVLILDGSIE